MTLIKQTPSNDTADVLEELERELILWRDEAAHENSWEALDNVVASLQAKIIAYRNRIRGQELVSPAGVIQYRPIGLIHSPFRQSKGMPLQPVGAANNHGSVELFHEYAEGLKDLEGFSHIILLYHFHLVRTTQLTVTPYMDHQPRGVFATRAPSRPNPIGISVVRLEAIEHQRLLVKNIDIIDNTPLLDVKPYVPEFDCCPAERIGWLSRHQGQVASAASDERFAKSRGPAK